MMTSEELEAAKVALDRKPRGKQARAFYRYVETLINEAERLVEVAGQDARDRQIAIGLELEKYKFPAPSGGGEYHTAQTAGKWQYDAYQGGEYYPQAMREADEKAIERDNWISICAMGDISVFELAEKIDCPLDEAKELTAQAVREMATQRLIDKNRKESGEDLDDQIPF